MSFNDTGGGQGRSLKDLLTLLGLARGTSQPATNSIADLQAMVERQRRLPRTGGLFGGDYARFMADNAPTAAPPSSPVRPLPRVTERGQSGARYEAALGRGVISPQADNDVVLDRGLAGPDDGAELIEIGNPANRRLRREWEDANGRPWPRDEVTGRNHDVAHIKSLADGGTNTLDNIRPMSRAEHLAEHMSNGDFARFARRAAIARAFGGRVGSLFPPAQILSDVLGILSGRIRMDSFDNFSSDMMGLPSNEDRQKAFEHEQKQLNPNWKPGEFYI